MNKSEFIHEVSTILLSLASIIISCWLLLTPIQVDKFWKDIPEQKVIIKSGHDYKTIKMVKIDMVWYVVGKDSSLKGKFKNVFPDGEIKQVQSPQTGKFVPIE